MKETFRFADDGFTIMTYTAGEEADVSALCAQVAVAEKWATLVKPASPATK